MKSLIVCMCVTLFLSAALLSPSLVFANPVPDSLVFEKIQNKQNVCVILGELHTWLKHRLTRSSASENETLLDEHTFEPGTGVDGTDIFVVTDLCVPAGDATYTLEEKRDDGWHVRAAKDFLVEESQQECDDSDSCDGLIDPDDYTHENQDDDSDPDDDDDDDSGGSCSC